MYTIREIQDGDLYVFQPMTIIVFWLTDLVPTGVYTYEMGPHIQACCRDITPLNGGIIETTA
jgi:hypothetical protein